MHPLAAALAAALALSLFGCGACTPPPTTPAVTRSADWAAPVPGTTLGNLHRVSDELYRSEQPDPKHIPELQKLGIRSLLSLREYHADDAAFARAGIKLYRLPMAAGSVAETDLVAALRIIQSAPKPVLVHCWHGSDRTGFIVAGYRRVIQGWDAPKAIDELRHGGFGYHAAVYPNVAKTLAGIDPEKVRAALASEPVKN